MAIILAFMTLLVLLLRARGSPQHILKEMSAHPETNKICEPSASGVCVWVAQVRQTPLSV